MPSETLSTLSFTISTAGRFTKRPAGKVHWCSNIHPAQANHQLNPVSKSAYISLIIRPVQCDEVSNRSLSLCCDLLTSVCRAALQFCDDALDCHLQVIIGTLTAQVTSRPAIAQQVRNKGVNSRSIFESSHAASKTQQETYQDGS